MSAFHATPSQRAAIDARGSAVLVSAGAGSGKTRVLTERLMGYICAEGGVDLDSFLVITFTRAAAGELRSRISEEISQKLAADPGNRRLRRQNALCPRAQIGTIHSFCAALLRENCHLIGLSPDFKIADDERIAAMKASALERVMDARYEQPDRHPGFTALADTVGAGRDDRRLSALVLTLHERMQCHARPALWAQEQISLLRAPAGDAADTVWGQEITVWARGVSSYWADEFDRLIQEISADEKIRKAYLESFSETASQLRELRRSLALGWDRARGRLPIVFPPLRRLVKPQDPALATRLKIRRDACKKDMKALEDALFESSASLLEDMARSADAMSALLSLTLDFDRAFAADKRAHALVDYADLEHLTAQLLTDSDGRPTPLARHLSGRYTEIMVDEYQDVSRVQDAIFRAISKDGANLFMVGDVKQSIYRFRLADPEIFTEKYLSYRDYASAAPGEPRRILLRENFRSRREVLDAANSVFSLCMSRVLGDMDYDESAALICGASYPDAGQIPEILLLDLPSAEGEEDAPDKLELEALLTAQQIQQLLSDGTTVMDGGQARPIEFGDIAILLRSANAVGSVYRRVLAEQGIPVASAQGSGFFDSVEISSVLSMLALIDDPHQDIPLIAALRSPAFGFSADELSAVRAADREGGLYSALCTAAESDGKSRRFLSWLSSLRATAPDLSAAELIWQLINSTNLLALCSAMPDGEQRRANLMELIELSERFESTGYRGVHRLVLWLRKLAGKGQEISAGSAQRSAVQIMSIHRSKGLEFPVVFLCDTARSFNRQDARETVLVHPVLGLGPKFTDLERRLEYPTLARSAIKLRLEHETLSEEMRLLYVALTRAKERLIVTAALRKAEEAVEKHRASLSRPMPPEALRQAGAMIDWLLYAALADGGEHLRLTLCPPPASSSAAEPETPCAEPDKAALETLRKNLSFSYAHERAVSLPSKITATELKGRSEEDPDASSLVPKPPHGFSLPDFARAGRPATGAERGVATHLVLQYMDFSQTASPEAIAAEIARLRALEFITAREAEAVEAAAIYKLFASPLGRRILAADQIIREFKFSLLVDAEPLFPEAGDEQLLLQGVVDCCIEEAGELTIIDYKTDRVRTEEEISSRAALYRAQLMAYASALRRIYQKPVRECVLYFLSPGRAVSLGRPAGD